MIDIQQLSFSYKRGKNRILNDFSLQIDKGQTLGLLGLNGAGKSTLLHLICGLLTPDSGQVLFNGINTRLRKPETLSQLFLVPEEFELPDIRLADYVKYYAPLYPHFSTADMHKYLDVFGLPNDLDLKALSMGQKKKVFMSFALAANTQLLIMDEPTNGLDIPSKSEFRKLIASGSNDERTLIISTHQIRDIDKILDHVLIVDNNRVLLNRSIADISEHLYFGETDSREIANEAIYNLSSIKGYSVLLPNTDGRESEINLEVLFNATLEHHEQINQCFTR